MKYIIILLLITLIGCKAKPDFYKDGKAYTVTGVCVKEHTEHFQYGYNVITKSFDYHYAPHTVCDSVRLDTTLFKTN